MDGLTLSLRRHQLLEEVDCDIFLIVKIGFAVEAHEKVDFPLAPHYLLQAPNWYHYGFFDHHVQDLLFFHFFTSIIFVCFKLNYKLYR